MNDRPHPNATDSPRDEELLRLSAEFQALQDLTCDVEQDEALPGLIAAAVAAFQNRGEATMLQAAGHSSPVATTLGSIGGYQPVREIGRGGMGNVYEALDPILNKRVAVKVLPMVGALNARSLQRFQIEAQAAAKLEHPHIVPILAAGADRGVHFYVMQLIEGENLSQVLRRLRARRELESKQSLQRASTVGKPPGEATVKEKSEASGPQEPVSGVSSGLGEFASASHAPFFSNEYFRTIATLGAQVAEALHHAHERGVVHRDVKPSNLLLDHRGHAWVADFGLAQIQGDPGVTITGALVGTLRYMSPEQALANRVVVDHRTDIYSLGVTLYEAIALRPAINAEGHEAVLRQIAFENPPPLRRLNRQVPRHLETIVLKAISKNPDDRFQSAAEFAEELRRIASNEPIKTLPPTAWELTARWARRRLGLLATIAAGILIMLTLSLAGSGLVYSAYSSEKRQRQVAEELLNESEALRAAAQSQLELPNNPGQALALAIEGRERLESPETNNTLLRALDANHELRTFSGHERSVTSLALTQDGRYLATASDNANSDGPLAPIRVWDTETGELRQTLRHRMRLSSVAFGPTGVRLLTASRLSTPPTTTGESPEEVGNPPIVWDALGGNRLYEPNDAFLLKAHAACFSPTGRQIVLPVRGHAARIFDAVDGGPANDGLLDGHDARVDFAAFSPTGRYVVTLSQDRTARLWDAATGAQLHKLDTWQSRGPDIAVFSSDERFLATGSQEGVHLWSVSNGQRLNRSHWEGSLPRFSRDGSKLFVTREFASLVQVYDTTTLAALKGFQAGGAIAKFDVSPRGDLLALGLGALSNHGRIELRRVEDGGLSGVLQGHTGALSDAVFSSDGRRVATAARDGTARLWSVESGGQHALLDVAPARSPFTVTRFDRQGEQFAVSTHPSPLTTVFSESAEGEQQVLTGLFDNRQGYASERLATLSDNRVVVWDITQRRQIAALETHAGEFRQARLRSDGRQAVLVVQQGPVWLWDFNERPRIELAGLSAAVVDAAFSPDGARLATGTADGQVALWSAETGLLLDEARIDAVVIQVLFSPNGQSLAVTSDHDAAFVFPLNAEATKLMAPSEFSKADCAFNEVQFARDDRLLTYHSFANQSVLCWNIPDRLVVGQWQEPQGQVFIQVERNRSEVLAAAENGLFWWDFENDQSRRLDDRPTALARFCPDTQCVVSATGGASLDPEFSPLDPPDRFESPTLKFWRLPSGALTRSAPLRSGDPLAMQFDDAGQLLLSTLSYSAAIYEKGARQPSVVLQGGHGAPISDLRFSPDGKLLATASGDQTAAIWKAGDGTLLHWLDGHQGPVTSLDFDPRQDQLATASADMTTRLWSVADGQSVATFEGHRDLIYQVLYVDNGERLLTNSRDGTLRVWNRDGTVARVITSLTGSYLSIDVSAEGALLAVPGWRQIPQRLGRQLRRIQSEPAPGAPKKPIVEFYRNLTDQPIMLPLEDEPVTAQLSADGKQAVLVDAQGLVHLWSLMGEPRELRILHRGYTKVVEAFFSPDSKMILANESEAISLWNATTGALLATYPDALGVRSVSGNVDPAMNPFTPGGQFILSIDRKGRLRRWPTQILPYALAKAPHRLTAEELQSFRLRPPP